MDKLELDIDFLVNNPEVKAAAEKAKADIAGVGQTAEQTFAKTAQAAKSGFNGLQNSINQISRELPAFTYSAQTGFMAIANNIPILTDQISQLRSENERLAASGQKGVPVWKQLVGGLFSWGTALSLGITLLTVYGKEIGEFIGSLFKGGEAIDRAVDNFKTLNQVMPEANKKAGKEIATLKILYQAATDVSLSMKDRIAAANELKKQFPSAFANSKTQAILNGEEKKSYDELTQAILVNARAKAAKDKLDELATKRLDIAFQKQKIQNANENEKNRLKSDLRKRASDLNETYTSSQKAWRVSEETVKKQIAIGNKASDERAKQALEEQNTLDKRLENQEKFLVKFVGQAELVEEITKNTPIKTGDKKEQQAFANRIAGIKNIREKLAALDKEYSGKYFTDDEKEQQALKAKFADFRKIIDEENAKITEYNKKNKNKLALIDVAQVAPIEKRAMSDLVFKQDTEKLKLSLTEQKRLYQEYEDYKLKFGEEAAKKQYSEKIKLDSSYLEQLQKATALATAQNILSGGSNETQSRLATLSDMLNKEQEEEKKAFEQRLVDFQTYADKRKVVQEKYLAIAADFRVKGKDAEAQEAIDKGAQEVYALDMTNIQKWDSYEKLFNGVEKLSKQDTLVLVAELEKQLQATDISAKARLEVEQKLNQLKKSIATGDGSQIGKLASELGAVAQEFSNINSNIGEIVGAISKAGQGYAGILENTKKFKEAKADKDVGGQIGAGLGIVSSGLSVVNAIGGWFKGLKEAKEKALKEVADFYEKAKQGEREYQSLLRGRERDEAARHNNRLAGLKEEHELLKKQLIAINSDYAAMFEQLQGKGASAADQQAVGKQLAKAMAANSKKTKDLMAQLQNMQSGEILSANYVHGTWFRKARTDYTYGSLRGKSYDDLEKLATQGKLTEDAKKLFEELKKLKQEGVDVQKQLEETTKSLNEMFTGINSDSLRGGFMQLFKDGKTSVADFADFFEKSMKDAAYSIFEQKYLATMMDGFYSLFADMASSGDSLTADEIARLKQQYEEMAKVAEARFADMKKITGMDLGGDGKSKSSLTEAVKGITSEQAGLLAGQFGGQRIATIEGNQINRDGFAMMSQTGAEQLAVIRQQHLTQMEIAANTLRTANNTDGLRDGLIDIKDEMQTLNKKISSNSNTMRAMGG